MCDRDLSKFDTVLSSLKNRFGRKIFPFILPVNEGPGFTQIPDVLKKEILEFSSNGDYSIKKPDEDLDSKLSKLHEELIEMVAESDEALLDNFFEQYATLIY